MQAWIRYTKTPAQQVDVNFQKKDYLSTLSLYHFDCINKESAWSQMLFYEGARSTGENVQTLNYQKDVIPKLMTTVAPGTFGEMMLDAVCAMRGYKK